MGKPETLPSHKTNEHTRGRLTLRHENINAFIRRTGAWASPKWSLVTRQTNTWVEDLHTRHTNSKAFVKRRSTWARRKFSLVTPNHKTNEHMRGRLTHKTRKFKSCEMEKYMGKLKMLPSHKTNEHKSKVCTQDTKFGTPLWEEEVHGQARNTP